MPKTEYAARCSKLLNSTRTKTWKDLCYRCALFGLSIDDWEPEVKLRLRQISQSKNNEDTPLLGDLKRKWYLSIRDGSPDWSIYSGVGYVIESFVCYEGCSRGYIKSLNLARALSSGISILDDLEPIKTIVDLGCGLGYTTAAIKELVPYADVYATNVDGSIQMEITRQLSKEYDFHVKTRIDDLPKEVDLVFASEYFEHFPDPLSHIDELLNCIKPRAWIIANTFGFPAIGHFSSYPINGSGEMGYGREVSRAFSKKMRQYNYMQKKTNLWRQRPSYYKKIEQA